MRKTKPKLYSANALRTLVTKLERHKYPPTMTLAEWFEACTKLDATYASFRRQDAAQEKLEDQECVEPEALAYVKAHMDLSVSRVVEGLGRMGIVRRPSWVAKTRRRIFDRNWTPNAEKSKVLI